MSGLLGKKIGMSNVFNANGIRVPVTIIEVTPSTVTNIRTISKDGYNALQLGYGVKKESRVVKPILGYFKKHNLSVPKKIKEFRLDELSEYKIGDELTTSFFKEGELIKVRGYSKGKGFQGVMKRHGFGGVGGTTHGQSDRLRAPGSIGGSSYPSRVFKGTRMAGRMGFDKVTVRNLKIIKIDEEKNIILVKGAIPGPANSMVELHKK